MRKRLSNEEMQNAISLANGQREIINTEQAKKTSDFVHKDKPPYGVLAGLGLVAGAATIIVAKTLVKDANKSKTIRNIGIAATAIAGALLIISVVLNIADDSIKRTLASTTNDRLEGQTENDISTSDSYTAATMVNALDQVGALSDIGIASSKIDLGGKVARVAQSTGTVVKALADDDLGYGITNLNTLNTNQVNNINDWFMK